MLQRSIGLAPESVTAHQDLAAAYVQLNQFEDAIRELRTALKLAPDLPQLHYNLGLALKMQDDSSRRNPRVGDCGETRPIRSGGPLPSWRPLHADGAIR